MNIELVSKLAEKLENQLPHTVSSIDDTIFIFDKENRKAKITISSIDENWITFQLQVGYIIDTLQVLDNTAVSMHEFLAFVPNIFLAYKKVFDTVFRMQSAFAVFNC